MLNIHRITKNFFILIFFVCMPFMAFAQTPSFSVSDYECAISEDNLGCFGAILLNGRQIGVRRCRARSRFQARRARRQRRRALRRGDFDLADTLTTRIDQLILARNSECRSCGRYDDPECAGEGETGEGGGGSGGESGSSNPSVSQACDVARNPGGAGSFSRSALSVRIANGAVCSNSGSSPVVALTQFGSPFCSGTLIAADTVLTAAHCFAETNSVNGLAVELQDGTSISMASFVANSTWPGGNSNVGDSAIVKLNGSFSGVNIASIYRGSGVAVGNAVAMAGYGESETGAGTLRATVNAIERLDSTRIETFYSLGQTDEGSTCVGDSGGPLFVFIEGQWKIVGVLSTGGPSNCLLDSGDGSFDESQWANLNGGNHLAFIDANS